MDNKKQNPIEEIKIKSRGLRGTLKESLEEKHTGNLKSGDDALVKFHGMYIQDDRDRRETRAIKKLERLYSFMIRLRIPGGIITPKQWLTINETSNNYGTGVIKITTRQTIQLHGLLKHELKDTIQSFVSSKLDSIAACGDVNRNVICTAYPNSPASDLHQEIHRYAVSISDYLLPKTKAYYEIFVDDEKIYEKSTEQDNLYLDAYLPRKFKIAIAIPPSNDVDIFANDAGLIAIIEKGKLIGFNLLVGGGLSTTHGNPNTYSRVASEIGFISGEENILKALYEVLTIQRDYGNREDRKLARIKYTIDYISIESFKKELEKRCGFQIEKAKSYVFTKRNDQYDWKKDDKEKWFYTLFVENGVINPKQKALLEEIAQLNVGEIQFTANQNLVIGNLAEENKITVEKILNKYNQNEKHSNLRKSSMACVALPTCPLALAEAQRYLPDLITKIEKITEKYAFNNDEIIIRMTGCPNGCGRSYLAEIGFVGTGPGQYNLMIGGDRNGTRLNKIYKEKLEESEILNEVDFLLKEYKTYRNKEETFGDFTNRYILTN